MRNIADIVAASHQGLFLITFPADLSVPDIGHQSVGYALTSHCLGDFATFVKVGGNLFTGATPAECAVWLAVGLSQESQVTNALPCFINGTIR